ncbi:MAG: acyltransferase family protein [Fluviicola sp.]
MIAGSSGREDNSLNRIQELDALRGIAALVVLVFHFSLLNPQLLSFTKFGITGVDLFFIISGFVITMSLDRIQFGYQFVINRFSRLYPTYWTSVIFTFAIICINKIYLGYEPQHPLPIKDFGYNLTMFQYYFGVKDLDGPYWTMIIEMLFYLLMLYLFLTKSLKSAVAFLIPVILLGTVLTEFHWFQPFSMAYFKNFPLAQSLPLFVTGILFYRIFTKDKRLLLNCILIISCYLLQILLFTKTGRANYYISHPEYKAVLLVYFALFFLFVFGKLKFIVSRTTLFLGKISFALYLIHQYFSIYFLIPNLMKWGINYYVAAFLIALPICVLLAAGITYGIEKRVGRWLKQLLNKLADKIVLKTRARD